MKRKVLSIMFALVLALSVSLISAIPALANDISSSTMHFEGSLTEAGGGVYTGTINMTAGEYYVAGGPGEGIYDGGGFDVYAREGGTAYVQGMTPDNWIIGSDHDAYSQAGPWGTWYDPDCTDWYQYSLQLTADHWYLRYTSTGESPMSGIMIWNGDGTGYAAETDVGTQNGSHGGSEAHGGGFAAWDWDCGWGIEVVPLEYLGFNVEITQSNGTYHVTLTPAAPYILDSSYIMFFVGTLGDNGDGTHDGVIPMTVGGGFNVYAEEGATAWFGDLGQNPVWQPQIISDHDAWPTWDPDTPDWYQYSLNLYEEDGVQKWALRNHPGATADHPWYESGYEKEPKGVPLSGVMDWVSMYAVETDIGAYLEGTGTGEIPGGAATYGGGPSCWDMDWSWGSEVVPLQYPGFKVDITDLGGGYYLVALIPAMHQQGFTTGGGWIDSPAGAYKSDLSLAGKASFGFVAKLMKGASAPDGQTQFIFKTASLNFHSNSYDWLVAAGSTAIYKGIGTINGAGEYKFKLWAGDDEPDTFRIKIWEEDELGVENVVYDNGMNQPISGGQIIVHKK